MDQIIKRFRSSKKCFINIQNFDDPARIKKIGKLFKDGLDFEDINFPVKIRDIQKIEKKNSIEISVFGYENKENYPLYVSKNIFKKHFDLLLIEGKDKKY